MKPIRILTDYQKEFIEDNFRTMTDKKIGQSLGLSETWVCLYRSQRKMLKTQKHAKVVGMKREVFFNVNKRWAWL